MTIKIKNYQVGSVIFGPNYSGQDDHDHYVVIHVLNPGQRVALIDDERDHNRISSDDKDMSFGYLSVNLNGEVDHKSPHSWSHGPKTFKVWRDHLNLGFSDSKVDRARALVTLDEMNKVLVEKQRQLVDELGYTNTVCSIVSLALATVHETAG
jgi:hypothetical protein